MAPGVEVRTLWAPPAAANGNFFIHSPVLHANGRILLTNTHRGLAAFDVISGEELAAVSLADASAQHLECYLQPGGWLLSSVKLGTMFWPARSDHDVPDRLIIGPPKQWSKAGRAGVSASADAKLLAYANFGPATLEHIEPAKRTFVLEPQRDVRATAISPDKRWVFTGSFNADPKSCVQIWDAATGKHIQALPLRQQCNFGYFSPDSRWLATNSWHEGCRLWEVGTWKEVRRYAESRAAFSPDSRLLALGDVFGQIRLIGVGTDRELARLTLPEPHWCDPVCFTPDGSRLVAAARDMRALYVWDLASMHQQLQKLGIAWDLSPFSPPAQAGRPQLIRFEMGTP